MDAGLEPVIALPFVAIVTCLGWGVRGEWGNWWGETVPGVLAGMALWLAFGESGSAWQMLAFGAVLAVAHTVGGEISYGQIVSYVASGRSLLDRDPGGDSKRSPLYGLAALFLVGGLIGFYPGVALGILASEETYMIGDFALWGAMAAMGALLFYQLVVRGLGFRLSPPRYDFWAPVLGASISTLAFFLPRDLSVIRTSLIAWLGYGLGFALGGMVHRRAIRARWPVDSWKLMEHSVGLFGGMGLAVAVLIGGGLQELALTPVASGLSLFVVFWFVPYLITTDVLNDWAFMEWLPRSPRSRPIVPEGGGAREARNGTWIRITSRRVFAAFQMCALLSILPFVLLSRDLVSSWDGSRWAHLLFALCISIHTLLGIVKYVPVGLDSRRKIIQTTYLILAGACVLMALAQ
jgi:hypothetical protein